MARDNKIQMPGVFGGLMRYDDEYGSKFMISPIAILVFVIAIVILVVILRVFFPIAAVPVGQGGFILPLLGFLKKCEDGWKL